MNVHLSRRLAAALLALLLLALLPAADAAARPLATAFPDGFYEQQIAGGFVLPTSFAVAPDGRIFVTEKNGAVRVVVGGVVQDEPFIDLSTEVNSSSDRGLMSVAVHPRWPATPYVYLAYTYDPPEVRGYSESGARVARVLRLEADRANLNVHKPGSGVILLGKNSTFENIGNPDKGDTEPFSCFDINNQFVQDCLPSEGTAHTIDFLKFARDGSLFVSMGDGIVNSKGNWRAQDPNSLAGKVLRIDPLTGAGYATNPFYDGDVNVNRAKVYALGLRNPFRFTFHPTNGEIYLGEVGNNTWEEINRGPAGANFGWPCYEGQEKMTDWPICDPLFNGNAAVTHGLYIYPHKAKPPRGAVIGGDFYTGRLYPAEYRGAYFFTDFNGGVIFSMAFARDGSYTLKEFATSAPGPIQISMGPDGNLWMIYIATGELVRLGYAGGAAARTTSPLATPTAARGASASAAATPAATRAATASLPAGAGTGTITRELWTGLSGKSIDDLLDSPNYPDSPAKREELTSLDAPRAGAGDYGQRIRGYVHPPATGQYRFWIASDDGSRLLLSSDDSAANAVVIASVPEWTGLQVWDKYAEQESALITLQAGNRYYIEVLHKQGDQKDNLSVAWQPPGGTRAIIAGEYLSPLGE